MKLFDIVALATVLSATLLCATGEELESLYSETVAQDMRRTREVSAEAGAAPVAPEEEANVPVIDIACFADTDACCSEAERATIVDAVFDASASHGIFQVAGHGVQTMDMSAEMKRFFDSSAEEKALVMSNSSNTSTLRGFRALRAENGGTIYGVPNAKPDGRETITFGPPRVVGHDPNVYSDDRMKAAIEAVYAELERLDDVLLGIFSAATSKLVGRPVDLRDYNGAHKAILRASHYPEVVDDAEGLLGHTDFGTFTIVKATLPGLQYAANGRWYPVPARADLDVLTINVGDMMRRWSNGHFNSVVHRVSNTHASDRHSFQYFATQDHDKTDLRVLEPILAEGELPIYEPVGIVAYQAEILSTYFKS